MRSLFRMYASYLRKTALFLLLAGFYFAGCILLLSRAGEYMALPAIVERQRSDAELCLYGSVIHRDAFFYKLEGEKVEQPEIISLGSSRVLQFRGFFFRKPFYNMGYAVDSIRSAEQLMTLLSAGGQPRILLLGVEPWWFNGAYAPAEYDTADHVPDPRVRFTDAIKLLPLFLQRKITPAQFVDIVFPSGTTSCAIGLRAVQARSGFGPDGSYYYTNFVTGTTANEDEGFANTRQRIALGRNLFVYGTTVDPTHWSAFVRWIRDLEGQGITVISFIPPLAPSMYQEMEKRHEQYAYIDDLLAKAKEENISLIDWRDARVIGSSDCECIDGFHGGSVTYARLLLALTERYPLLLPYVDVPVVERFIADNAGKAMEREPRLTEKPEVDFLKLGCEK